MLKRIFATDAEVAPAILRLVLGVVFFPHGAQKVLGWFGGHGFSGTMHGMESQGIPALFAFLAILAEFGGSIALITGFLTRIAAAGITTVMLVAIAMVHAKNGFFMNWMGNQKGEGFEYHLLAIAIGVALMIKGGGIASIDRAICHTTSETKK